VTLQGKLKGLLQRVNVTLFLKPILYWIKIQPERALFVSFIQPVFNKERFSIPSYSLYLTKSAFRFLHTACI